MTSRNADMADGSILILFSSNLNIHNDEPHLIVGFVETISFPGSYFTQKAFDTDILEVLKQLSNLIHFVWTLFKVIFIANHDESSRVQEVFRNRFH